MKSVSDFVDKGCTFLRICRIFEKGREHERNRRITKDFFFSLTLRGEWNPYQFKRPLRYNELYLTSVFNGIGSQCFGT
jgi:hypothetical protein